jgi:hypothetical protein
VKVIMVKTQWNLAGVHQEVVRPHHLVGLG